MHARSVCARRLCLVHSPVLTGTQFLCVCSVIERFYLAIDKQNVIFHQPLQPMEDIIAVPGRGPSDLSFSVCGDMPRGALSAIRGHVAYSSLLNAFKCLTAFCAHKGVCPHNYALTQLRQLYAEFESKSDEEQDFDDVDEENPSSADINRLPYSLPPPLSFDSQWSAPDPESSHRLYRAVDRRTVRLTFDLTNRTCTCLRAPNADAECDCRHECLSCNAALVSTLMHSLDGDLSHAICLA